MKKIKRPLVVWLAALSLVAAGSAVAFAGEEPAPAAATVRRLCDRPTKPRQMACFALRRTDLPAVRGLRAATPKGYGPADLQTAYHLPASAAPGPVVAIVDAYDYPSAEADLAVYRKQYGLPPCTAASGCFRKVNQDGRSDRLPDPDEGWAGEMALDLDMVSAVCPQCSILLVETDSASGEDLFAGVNRAVAMGAKFVSNSWGGAESADNVYTDESVFHHPGVAITVSAGDDGYGVEYPASSPYVTAVGGTSLVKGQEKVWAGSGSGCASLAAKPAFQHDKLCPGRSEADVAAVADPDTGVAVYDSYGEDAPGWNVSGGTSASAPIIAGVYALAGALPAGAAANSLPYEKPEALHDVTAGSNGKCGGTALCAGAKGFDGPTGLGTPNGTSAFRAAGYQQFSGRVLDARHHPIAGARVTIGPATSTTDHDGRYLLAVKQGGYQAKVDAWGRLTSTVNAATAKTVVLKDAPMTTVRGTVHDGSGHGWGLGARIAVVASGDGARPDGYVWADSATGAFSFRAEAGQSYTLAVDGRGSNGSAYVSTRKTVVAGKTKTVDVALKADKDMCAAIGYQDTDVGDCVLVPGGIVRGYFRDHTTGKALTGAVLRPAATALNGPALVPAERGWYETFEKAGSHKLTAALAEYATTEHTVAVTKDKSARQDFELASARLTAAPGKVGIVVPQGGHGTATVTVRNTGSAASPLGALPATAAAAAGKWQAIPDYPAPVSDAAAAADDGRVYVTGGQIDGGASATASVYDPAVQAWGPLPDMHSARKRHVAGVIGDALYVAGGFNENNADLSSVERFDFVTRRWTVRASAPEPVGAVGGGVVDGKLYAGACGDADCSESARTHMYAYDPARDSWTRIADYPIGAWANGCAGVAGRLYCAGGWLGGDVTAKGYAYDPGTNKWTAITDLPAPTFEFGASVAGGRFVVASGANPDGRTGHTYAYDPATRKWNRLADDQGWTIWPAAACGLYLIGGHRNHYEDSVANSERLNGDCPAPAPIPWLSTTTSAGTVAPGASATVTVRVDAGKLKPGSYDAVVPLHGRSPYGVPVVDVTMTVQ